MNGPGSSFSDKVQAIDQILSQETICLDSLRDVCFTGVPEHSNTRDICWKVLLGYLPLERSKWEQELNEKRQLYNDYMNEFIVQPGYKDQCQTATSKLSKSYFVQNKNESIRRIIAFSLLYSLLFLHSY